MEINVTLTTKRLVFLSLGFTFLGVLVFLSGIMLGAKVRGPDTAEREQTDLKAMDRNPLPTPKETGEKKAPEPAVPGTAKAAEEKTVPPATETKKEDVAIAKAPPEKEAMAPLPGKPDAKAGEPARKGKADNAPEAVPAEAPKDKPKAESPAEPAQAKAKTPEAGAAPMPEKIREPKSYTVQVGAFLEKDNAEDLAEDLKDKGYAPYIISVWDSMKRQWHTVRLGDYDTQEEAAKAAGEFAKKERMAASIRGVGAL